MNIPTDNIPTDLTVEEAAHFKDAHRMAYEVWEERYHNMLANGYDPDTADYLASIGENVDSAFMETETDIINRSLDVINGLRIIPDDPGEIQVQDNE